MKYCTSCGAVLIDDAIFCTKCGVSTVRNSESRNESHEENNYSWQRTLEIIFTIVLPIIVSLIIIIVSSSVSKLFGSIDPSSRDVVGATSFTVTLIGIVVLFFLSWLLWAIGKFIGKRLSSETGIILGIVLIVFGFTLYIGIPIIIYSRGGKKVEVKVEPWKQAPNNAENINYNENKKCPFCAELIKREAKICRYCGKDINYYDTTNQIESTKLYTKEDNNVEYKECPFCNYLIKREAKICKFCGRDIVKS